MIVTSNQLELILSKRLTCNYVAPYLCETWRPRQSYLIVYRWRIVDDRVQVTPTQVAVTVIDIDDPVMIRSLEQVDVMAAGFKTTDAFRASWAQRHPRSATARRVTFALGDWRDRPRFLAHGVSEFGDAGGNARGYTGSALNALDDAECVSDEWLERFAREADKFRAALLGRQRLKRSAKQDIRSKARH